ncbi:MAG: glycosyltransferase [Armatimonadetes bacterium]|nr:glycosyltransferase [Armatimonadota bacterium]
MSDRPLVSVLFTSYKHETYLRECLDSALNQTYENVEVIVVDDNSPDSSPEILRSYGERVRLVQNEQNRGTYGVLNQALELARGKYAAVLNSDDAWLPKKIELQVALMESDPAMAFCHTFGDFIDEDGNVIGGKPMGFEFPRTPTGDLLPLFIERNHAIASSVMMRADMARMAGGFDESFRNIGDWDMWLRLAAKGTVGFVDEKLTFYRVHSHNTIYRFQTSLSEDIRIRLGVLERRRELLHKWPALRKQLAHAAACLATEEVMAGDPRKGRELYLLSLQLHPGRFKSVLRYLATLAPKPIRSRIFKPPEAPAWLPHSAETH